MEKQYLGLRPGRKLLGRLGQNGVRPELTGTGELLLGGTPPGGRVPGQRGQLALDDVLECPLDGDGVERAVADTLDDLDDTLDDLVVLAGDTGQLLDGGHDDLLSLP